MKIETIIKNLMDLLGTINLNNAIDILEKIKREGTVSFMGYGRYTISTKTWNELNEALAISSEAGLEK